MCKKNKYKTECPSDVMFYLPDTGTPTSKEINALNKSPSTVKTVVNKWSAKNGKQRTNSEITEGEKQKKIHNNVQERNGGNHHKISIKKRGKL